MGNFICDILKNIYVNEYAIWSNTKCLYFSLVQGCSERLSSKCWSNRNLRAVSRCLNLEWEFQVRRFPDGVLVKDYQFLLICPISLSEKKYFFKLFPHLEGKARLQEIPEPFLQARHCYWKHLKRILWIAGAIELGHLDSKYNPVKSLKIRIKNTRYIKVMS